jgi:hypothetical protein
MTAGLIFDKLAISIQQSAFSKNRRLRPSADAWDWVWDWVTQA